LEFFSTIIFCEYIVLLHQLKLANRFAKIFAANQGSDDAACPKASKEELTQSCGKKTAKIWQVLVGGAINMQM